MAFTSTYQPAATPAAPRPMAPRPVSRARTMPQPRRMPTAPSAPAAAPVDPDRQITMTNSMGMTQGSRPQPTRVQRARALPQMQPPEGGVQLAPEIRAGGPAATGGYGGQQDYTGSTDPDRQLNNFAYSGAGGVQTQGAPPGGGITPYRSTGADARPGRAPAVPQAGLDAAPVTANSTVPAPTPRARTVRSVAPNSNVPTNQRYAPNRTAAEYAQDEIIANARDNGRRDGKRWWLGSDGKEYSGLQKDESNLRLRQTTDFRRELEDPMSEASLRDRWQQGMEYDAGNVDDLGGAFWDDYDKTGQAIDQLDQWSPSELEGFDTTGLRDIRSGNRERWSPTALDGFDSTETRNVNLNGLRDYSPRALQGVNTSRLANFDGGGAMQQYLQQSGGGGPVQAGTSGFDAMASVEKAARGASGIAKQTLADQLEQETNAAARSGRLNIGEFDVDKGRVVTRVGENLNNEILNRSVDAAGIQASIENSNAGNITQANVAGAGLRSAEAREAAQLGYQALDSATGYDVDVAGQSDKLGLDAADSYAGRSIDRAAGIDRNRLTAAEATDKMRRENAGEMDDFALDALDKYTGVEGNRRQRIDELRLNQRGAVVGARGGQASLSAGLWGEAQDRYGDRIASERDRITGRNNAAGASAANAAAARNARGQSIAGGAASGAATGAMFGPWGALAGGIIGGGAAYFGGR